MCPLVNANLPHATCKMNIKINFPTAMLTYATTNMRDEKVLNVQYDALKGGKGRKINHSHRKPILSAEDSFIQELDIFELIIASLS